MEFFRIADIITTEKEIQQKIGFATLEKINPEIVVLEGNKEVFQIGSFWGEFTLRRDEIMGGIRFSMLDCPNALAWSITTGYPPAKEKVVIHLTINRQQKPQEFIDEINEFMEGWIEGLENNY